MGGHVAPASTDLPAAVQSLVLEQAPAAVADEGSPVAEPQGSNEIQFISETREHSPPVTVDTEDVIFPSNPGMRRSTIKGKGKGRRSPARRATQ